MVGGRSFLVAFSACLLACGGSPEQAAAVSSEGMECYPNGTCDQGLTCLSTLCVHVVLDGGAGKVDAQSPGDAGGVMGADAAPPPPFSSAPHPALPQMGTLGGP